MIEYTLSKFKKLQIVPDDTDGNGPREWDNLGVMVCFNNRYRLGDDHGYSASDYETWDDIKQMLIKDEGAVAILPLYLIDHSGLSISTKPFGCSWDSGRVGFIYTNKEKMKEMGCEKATVDKLEKWLEGEVEAYDTYLRGDVWGFRLLETGVCNMGHTHENELDSCWGFYGDNIFENGMIDHISLSKTEYKTLKAKVG